MNGPDSSAANAEADLYGLLSESLSFPNAELAEAVDSGRFLSTIGHLLGHLSYDAGAPLDGLEPPGLPAGELEAEYIRLFDLPDRTPTPLYTGVYAPRRRDAMEELLRLYRHFGLTVDSDAHDLPDFVPTVLEFIRFLAEGTALGPGETREARERAMADVLERHLCPWAEQTADRLGKRDATPFYRALVDTVKAVSSTRLRQLRASYPGNAAIPMVSGYRPSR